jgi:hypothetical protein
VSQPPKRPTPPIQPAVPPVGRRPPEVERALALKEVMDHAVKVQKETTGPFGRRKKTGRIWAAVIICVPLLALSVYSYVAKPEFIWGPKDTMSPVVREANVRFALFLMAQRVEAYHEAHGSYPATLDAIEPAPDVRYRLMSDSVFEMRSMGNGAEIVFRSDQDVSAFLGNSIQVIQGTTP